MKKNSSLLYSGAALLGLSLALATGCTGIHSTPEEIDRPTTDGTTALRLAVAVAPQGTRAVDDGTTEGPDDPGTAGEQSISSMDILLKRDANSLTKKYKLTDLFTPKDGVITSPVFAVDNSLVGDSKMAVLLNSQLASPRLDPDATLSISNFSKFYREGTKDFLMTSTAGKTVTIKDDIRKEQVVADGTNDFTIGVERVVSKLQVYRAADVTLTDEVAADKGTLNVSNLKYAMAGSAKTVYLYRDHATETKEMGDDQQYSGVTAIDTETTPDLQKVSDTYTGTSATALTANFTAKSVPTEKADNAIYFLENSYDKPITVRDQLPYNRIAYVKVYGTFQPSKWYIYNEDAEKLV